GGGKWGGGKCGGGEGGGGVGGGEWEGRRGLVVKLDPGPGGVVSHYPLLTRHRKPEARWHRLKDWKRVRDAAAECGASLWLHGHKHAWYVLPAGEGQPFPSVCVGSSTQADRWGYHEYAIDGWTLAGLRRGYDPAAGAFVESERV